jgi:hypothetical protein
MVARSPLRISTERIALYGLALAILTSLPYLIFPSWFHDVATRGDFANFWSGGSTVGSATLLDPRALAAWQIAHHLQPQTFVYPPAFAWLYAPLAPLGSMGGMVVADIGMVAIVGGAALLAARIYALPKWFALAAVFAWAPTINAIEVGQNTGIALLLALVAIWALVGRRPAIAGLAIGALLYKPSLALPFVVLLLVRREWRAFVVAVACAGAWYVLSVLATHGDWSWPQQYLRIVRASAIADFPGNAFKAYTLPTLLLAMRVPITVATLCAAAVFIAAIPLLARARALEAASVTSLVGLATSIHAWPYEATLLLPTVFYAMVALPEPPKTRLVAFAYVIAAVALSLPYCGHALALLTIGGVSLWFYQRYRTAGAGYRS